jgi:hypothetical protein
MGILMCFYAGDTPRIVEGWKSGNGFPQEDEPYVAAHADLSFHLSEDDLDQLMSIAASIVQVPSTGFIASIQENLEPASADSNDGIHVMSDAFIALFASIPPARTDELYRMWCAILPQQEIHPARTPAREFLRRTKRNLACVPFALIFAPILLGAWLFSPGFRKERTRNKAQAALRKTAVPGVPEYTMREAIDALVRTCRIAKASGMKVIYIWTL